MNTTEMKVFIGTLSEWDKLINAACDFVNAPGTEANAIVFVEAPAPNRNRDHRVFYVCFKDKPRQFPKPVFDVTNVTKTEKDEVKDEMPY